MIWLYILSLSSALEGGVPLGDNKQVDRMIHATKTKDRQNWRKMGGKNYNKGAVFSLGLICVIWYFAAHAVKAPFIFPYLEDVAYQVVY